LGTGSKERSQSSQSSQRGLVKAVKRVAWRSRSLLLGRTARRRRRLESRHACKTTRAGRQQREWSGCLPFAASRRVAAWRDHQAFPGPTWHSKGHGHARHHHHALHHLHAHPRHAHACRVQGAAVVNHKQPRASTGLRQVAEGARDRQAARCGGTEITLGGWMGGRVD
jgi:hypothetical protein